MVRLFQFMVHLEGSAEVADIDMLESTAVHAFLEKAAAAEPTPGGGGISALAGALAATMAEMTLNFTVGKKKFADVDQEARRLLSEITAARGRLEELIAEDAEGYAAVAAALKMPRATSDEKSARRQAMKAAMRKALAAPLAMVRTMRSVAVLLPGVLEVGNPNLSGDAAVAASILPGAARAAALNVWQNISAFEADERGDLAQEITAALAEIKDDCGVVSTKVEEKLCPRTQAGPTSR